MMIIDKVMNLAAFALAVEILKDCEAHPEIEQKMYTLTEMLRVVVEKQKGL